MTYQPSQLISITHGDFRKLIQDNLGDDASEKLWDSLVHPDVIIRTRNVLGSLSDEVTQQLAQANADLTHIRGAEGRDEWQTAKGDQADWRGRALGYQRLVKKRITFVRDQATVVKAQIKVNAFSKEIRRALRELGTAVRDHQETETGASAYYAPRVLPGTSADRLLWRSLDDITLMGSAGEVTLRQWLEFYDVSERAS